jgi:hypothetical protein
MRLPALAVAALLAPGALVAQTISGAEYAARRDSLAARDGRMTGTLFLQARDPGRALYDGFPPDSSVVARETGLSARSFSALRPMLDSLAGTGLPFYTLRDFSNSDYAGEWSRRGTGTR